ncbi:hypothetical protein KEM54_004585 [Ascosphaera aggregata]|nr:hypothetical protein KEM54_004585 [Ascosphaera aggregata]
MTVKVLYTFDSESKTTCLARWPHLLDIQTAYLDEDTQVGVIELRTCIQAIVSASPELVARISNDYTIYAYDYSEYETPLVGQGMLSWILAATSTTPDAPAHQSKTIVTGRVCKNVGPFSRGAQETLEVRLKLVPVPISLQTEYNNSMAKYRDTANALCSDFDIERWASFVQQNHSNGGQDSSHSQHQQHYASCPPAITDGYTSERERCSSPSARSGIEHFQALLTECATPRDLGSMSQVSEGFRAGSPALSVSNNNSNNNNNQMTPTPRNNRPASPAISIARPASRAQQTQQQLSYHQPLQTPQQQQRPQQPQPQQQQQHSSIQKKVRGSRSISRANSMSHNAPTSQFIGAAAGAGPGNCTSGYDSSDEAPETSAPKRAKLMKPARPNLNIEKQRTSLLKAASNAASVRIHRPRPTKPGMDGQVISTGEEHIRPPTPVPKGPINPHHYTGNNRNSRGGNARGSTKLRRHSSV